MKALAVSYHPTVDTIAARLHRDGWSVGDVAVKYPTGWVWVVAGQRGGRWVVAEGRTQEAAWHAAGAEAKNTLVCGEHLG